MSYKKYLFKIIVVGDGMVGKTSLLNAFIEKKFTFDYKMTLGANILKKTFTLPEKNAVVNVSFWDIAGQTLFKGLRRTFFEGANAVMLVFDLTRPETFENLEGWFKDLKKFVKLKKAPGILVGNKSDLKRKITTEKAEEYANKINFSYIETSALHNRNVMLAFHSLLNILVPGLKP